MRTVRSLVGVAVLMLAIAISTATASAKFVSTNGHTSGPLQLKGSSPLFTILSGGEPQLSFRCTTLERGVWKIRKSETAQSEVLEGGHLNTTGQYNGCIITLGDETKAVIINSTCELQITQTGATTFTGGVTSDCSLTWGGCVITIAASAANKGLLGVSVVNIEAKSAEIHSSVTGFIMAPNEKCKNLGLNGTTGIFLQTVVAHEQRVE